MLGDRLVMQECLFYQFRLDDHVPADHMLRAIDQFVDLEGLRRHLAPFYSATGRPSIDPELMIRMLLVGYCFGIRSERRLVKRCILIWPIAGSVSSGWTAKCRITRPFRRTAMVASGIAMRSGMSSRRW